MKDYRKHGGGSAKPPGGDIGGPDMPYRPAEAGAGASPADMRRQYKQLQQPDPRERRDHRDFDAGGGFVPRPPFPTERN